MKTFFPSPAVCINFDAVYVRPLAHADCIEDCGGKALHLGHMMRNGIAVPTGFVVTDSAFQEFLHHNDLHDPIAGAVRKADVARPESWRLAAQAIRGIVTKAEVPGEIWDTILQLRWETLPGATLVVRSSAIGEDSRHAAFAGQLDSVLNVESDEALQDALLTCWASYWSERSLFYQQSRNAPLQGMGVVIQQQIASRISGVLFTQDPADHEGRNHLVAEYCYGYGDALVSGVINPGRLTIQRDGLSWQVEAAPDQTPLKRSLSLDDLFLNPNQISKLAQAGLLLEQAFEGPQDIEWTIDGTGKLHLLQSRPITVAPVKKVSRDTRPTLWSNANVNENFPEPISPLLYSIASAGYYHYFRNLALALGISPRRVAAEDDALRHVIGVHGARMYYNLSNIHGLMRMVPFGRSLVEWFNSFVGVTQSSPEAPGGNRSSRQSVIAAVNEWRRIVVKTTWRISRLARQVAEFERTVDQFARRTDPRRLHGRPLEELRNNLREFMEIRCHRWVNASLADAAAMISYGILKRLLNREFPGKDLSSLHNSLLKGLREVVSSGPIAALWELSRISPEAPEFRRAFDAYLEDWGFRCSGELMLTVPSFQEKPQALIEMLEAYRALDGPSPMEQLVRQQAARTKETLEIMKKLKRRKLLPPLPWPTKATLLKMVLAWTQKAICLRERARLKQALLYSRCRRIALAIGESWMDIGRLERRDDIVYLTYEEIDALLAGSAMFPDHVKGLVRLRKEAHAQLSEMAPPESFELPAGSYLDANNATLDSPKAAQAPNELELTGVGACGGQVTAPVAILEDVSQCGLLSAGEILVTRQTDPGWGPVFFLIKGLVMERGGMLSHGAILAREYGIPTVVGVNNATKRITSGQTICVNGDRGVVRLEND